jgi:putative membrane protein
MKLVTTSALSAAAAAFLLSAVALGAAGAADQDFVKKAYSINRAEIDLGHMAEQKGTAPEVKSFGARMVADHTKALDDLKAAAHKDGVATPTAVLPAQKQLEGQLSQLTGKPFDDAYMKHMITGHGAAIDVFTQEIAKGTSPSLRAYAEQSLPMLESHERAADQGEDQLRNPGR